MLEFCCWMFGVLLEMFVVPLLDVRGSVAAIYSWVGRGLWFCCCTLRSSWMSVVLLLFVGVLVLDV